MTDILKSILALFLIKEFISLVTKKNEIMKCRRMDGMGHILTMLTQNSLYIGIYIYITVYISRCVYLSLCVSLFLSLGMNVKKLKSWKHEETQIKVRQQHVMYIQCIIEDTENFSRKRYTQI